MIRYLDDDFNRYDEIDSLCRNDPFGVRILSYLETYDRNLSFIDFWYQEDKKGRIIAGISRFEDRYTLYSKYTRNRTKLLELREFIEFRSPSSVMFDFKLKIDFDELKKAVIGDVLKFKPSHAKYKDMNDDYFCRPDIDCCYEILKMNQSETFNVPDYNNFLSDITYRKNRNRAALFGIKHEDSTAGVCMTVSESNGAVILGAVATVPQYQGMGYASKLVNRAASLLLLEGKDVYIFSMREKTTKLYRKIGFTRKCNFIEYVFR